MPSIIFLMDENGKLVEMKEEGYDSESKLQELLAGYPDLLAGSQIDNEIPRKWILIKRESAVPLNDSKSVVGFVDHLFIDQDAIPTLVEVKRSSDTRIRREVVGQMLDYAANAIMYWPVEKIRTQFEENCREEDREPEEELRLKLETDMDYEEFWQMAKTNLLAGKIRMLFVSDEIPRELQRVVEFLNEQMDPAEVLAVEIKRHAAPGLKTYVPRVIGQISKAQQRKSTGGSQRRTWAKEEYFQELRVNNSEDIVRVVERILNWAKEHNLEVRLGSGAKHGSYSLFVPHKENLHYMMVLYTYGKIEMQFLRLKYEPPFDDIEKQREFLARMNRIDGIDFPESMLDRRPSFEMALLKDEAKYRQFVEVMEWYVGEIRSS